MKPVIQIIALFVVVVGGVFGLTFLTQYTRKPADSSKEAGPVPVPTGLVPLKIGERTAEWDKSDPDYKSLEVEKGTSGHYDFLVRNENDKPVTVTLNSKSCTCANVKIAIVPASERSKLVNASPLPTGLQIEPYVGGAQWKQLLRDRDAPSVMETVPAADATGPQFAVIRLGWEAKEEKATTLRAEIHGRIGSFVEYLTFDVPIVIVAPIMESNKSIQVGDIKPGDHRDVPITLWSATRDHITVDARLNVDDPCIQLSEPRPLSAQELKDLPFDLLKANLISGKTHPKCGYTVTASVYESRGGSQLDLGPLSRKITINSGTDSEVSVTLEGTVRGSIRVDDLGARDRVALGVFSAVHGKEKMVTLISTEPGVQLAIDQIKPDELKAELVQIKSGFGTPTWKLTVVAPPNTMAGPLPADSAIYLKTQSNPPRRVRIPVTGNASG